MKKKPVKKGTKAIKSPAPQTKNPYTKASGYGAKNMC